MCKGIIVPVFLSASSAMADLTDLSLFFPLHDYFVRRAMQLPDWQTDPSGSAKLSKKCNITFRALLFPPSLSLPLCIDVRAYEKHNACSI